MAETEITVYMTEYFNQFPEDGYEIGGVYSDRETAEDIVETRYDAQFGWKNSNIREFTVKIDV